MALPVHMEPFVRSKVLFVNKQLIVAISRDGEMLIPGGQDTVIAGDVIYLLGTLSLGGVIA